MLKLKANKALIDGCFKTDILITIKDEIITSVEDFTTQKFDAEYDIISPGFIDNHTHGADGYDFMDATDMAYKKILTKMASQGTTSVIATSITQSKEELTKMLKFCSNYENKTSQTQIEGIHFEGPFISLEKKGAQPGEYIIKLDKEALKYYQDAANNKISVMTYAPENDLDGSFTKLASTIGMLPQMGHTMATKEDIERCIDNGLVGATHVYNAMPKGDDETTGFVAKSKLYSEIICDGVHNDADKVKKFIETHSSKRTILITDSLMARGLKDGEYILGGQTFIKEGLSCRLKSSGALAGSVASMIDVIKKCVEFTGLPLDEVISMASYNVATYHNFKNLGNIKVGYRADLCCLTNDLDLEKIIIKGRHFDGI